MAESRVDDKLEVVSRLIVDYCPDTGTLTVSTQERLGEGFTVAPNLVVFYDPVDADCPVGFIMHSAETELKPFLDAISKKQSRQKHEKPGAR